MKTLTTSFAWLLALVLLAGSAAAQTVVNSYARITAQAGAVLTYSSLSGSFAPGDEALLMQVKDDVIGANTANVATFGDLSAIQSAGRYERVTLTAVGGSTITLAAVPGTTFNYSANTRVQLVSFPDLGAGGNYATTAALGALAWNGSVGGVLAFRVGGTLTLNHNLVADGRGFRGGVPNPTSKYVACDAGTYVDAGATYYWYGRKGEGIYDDNGAYPVGRGHLLSGGGGGNDVNAGGGGGGNFTAGGLAGPGWNNTPGGCSPSAGGLGGAGLSAHISATRVFMGGGGGGGQQNDNVATAGGAGGGIILVRATSLVTLPGCGGGGINISANGQAASNAGNDGAGGGGAGGSILLQIVTYSLNGACPLNLSASGAQGGNVNTSSTHGGGGGGGKGVVILANASTTPNNMSVTANVGQGGANYTAGTTADPGAPSLTSPLLLTLGRPLPVVLSRFEAQAAERGTLLAWTTASERNNDRFEVERARGQALGFERIGTVAGHGNSAKPLNYNFVDNAAPGGVCYYRLRQVDADGTVSYSPVRAVRRPTAAAEGLNLYPNPATTRVILDLANLPAAPAQARLLDLSGRELLRQELPGGEARPELDLHKLTPGLYQVVVEQAGHRWVQKLVKE